MIPSEVEVAIIGAGTAGMAAYRELRKTTDRIALIEAGPFGTTCARVGCMPSKLLIAPAEARHRVKDLPAFGVEVNDVRVDGPAVLKRMRDERDRFVGFVKEAVDDFDHAHVIRARATFVSNTELELQPPDIDRPSDAVADNWVRTSQRLKAGRIIIATGSHAHVPDAFKSAGDRLITSDDVFYWNDLPDSVAVVGGGVVGLELGQALHRLGVRVRLFGKDNKLAVLSDPDVLDYALEHMANALPLTPDLADMTLTRDGDAVVIDYETGDGSRHTERFDYLLAATGRRPNLDGLNLEQTGLALDDHGVPDHNPRSSQARLANGENCPIFICGDVNNELPLLHEAADEGRLAGENAARFPDVFCRVRRTPLGIVFSDPQIAYAGKRYQELQDEGTEFVVGEASFDDQGRARVMLINHGLLRIYGEPGTARILGAEMIGPAAEHMAHLIAWMIQADQSVEDVVQMPFYHPTLEEGLRTAFRNLLQALDMGPQPPLHSIDCGPGG